MSINVVRFHFHTASTHAICTRNFEASGQLEKDRPQHKQIRLYNPNEDTNKIELSMIK